MSNTSSVRRRSLRSTSEASLIEGFISVRSPDPELSIEIAGGPARATVHVRVAEGQSHPLTLDGSGCGLLRLRPHAGGASVTIVFGDRVMLRGSTPLRPCEAVG